MFQVGKSGVADVHEPQVERLEPGKLPQVRQFLAARLGNPCCLGSIVERQPRDVAVLPRGHRDNLLELPQHTLLPLHSADASAKPTEHDAHHEHENQCRPQAEL